MNGREKRRPRDLYIYERVKGLGTGQIPRIATIRPSIRAWLTLFRSRPTLSGVEMPVGMGVGINPTPSAIAPEARKHW